MLVPVHSFLLVLSILLSALPVFTKKVAAFYILQCDSHSVPTHIVFYSVLEVKNSKFYHVN